jgi:hypothetical protein
MVLTVSFVLSLVIGLFCHHPRCDAEHRHQVEISVEISGPHDFAVRLPVHSSRTPKASIASRPTFVTMANAPLSGETGEAVDAICPTG